MIFLPFALKPSSDFTFSTNDLLPTAIFMSSVSNLPCEMRSLFHRGMPNVPWNKMSLCSRHMYSEKNGLFTLKKLNIGLFQRSESTIICLISVTSRGPTPFHFFLTEGLLMGDPITSRSGQHRRTTRSNSAGSIGRTSMGVPSGDVTAIASPPLWCFSICPDSR